MDLQELKKTYDFSGKTVIITGGGGVLGGEMACALVGCNANVAILDRDLGLAKQVFHRIEMMGDVKGKAAVVYADVLEMGTLVRAVETIRQEFGNVHALINAAGGNRPEATTSADLQFFDLPISAMQFVFELNILGTILPSQAFGRVMAEQNEGVVLNMSSMSAFQPLTRVPAYSAAKAGINSFTQWLAVHMAQEYSPQIRVNAIAPGFFLTHQNRFLLTDEETGELTDRGRTIIEHTPMGRFGDPVDLLGTVLWLLSDASAFVTGVVVPIDGGYSAFSGV
ncbi:MAG: SDR family oxidoreductase [Chloroflexota bacterium]|nr:SDR family oxidoreductase [Chloroflexota bacterium]